jgi:hypothetical protein
MDHGKDGKKVAEVKRESLAAAERLLDGPNR